jgi:hypothetical protein
MMWRFVRGGENLTYEVRRNRGQHPYQLVIIKGDGSEVIEEIEQPTDLVERTASLMNSLRREGWDMS